jgi:ribosomal protein S27AE
MPEENLLQIDVEKRTTRGRSCPRCGGKIIPSDRAVYQSTGDPNDVFPIWQCERCGYEEVGEKRKPAGKAKH